ncbi:hypothetical protein [Streptomyces jeddahensis]|uniref:hypothetical protein n=1 Tax=Streptomyces jeddahensis TaxID=1716141 RepID=UPI001E5F9173|nr:hypothetical protein [Streptomyces jeddahensis]
MTRWLKGSIPRGNVPQFIADAIGRKLGRQLVIDDIGMGDAAVSAVQPDLGLDFADKPESTAKTVTDLWRADLADAETLVRALPDSAAWNAASLRWIVAPPDGALTRTGNRAVGAVDVDMVRSTTDAFSMLDGKFGGGHARRALIQYCTRMSGRCSTASTPTTWAGNCTRPWRKRSYSPAGCRTTAAFTASLSGTSSRHYA